VSRDPRQVGTGLENEGPQMIHRKSNQSRTTEVSDSWPAVGPLHSLLGSKSRRGQSERGGLRGRWRHGAEQWRCCKEPVLSLPLPLIFFFVPCPGKSHPSSYRAQATQAVIQDFQ
jgi:hypothetical protein